MNSGFDLEALVSVEQSFYDDGYKDGFAHGRIHGLIEGRALGKEKGFEMWEELGFYEGFALAWKVVYDSQTSGDDRATHHMKHLVDLIAQFPRSNPSVTEQSDLDIPKLFRQIRSRYKALCATLGVRPSLRAGETGSSQDEVEDTSDTHGPGTKNTKKNVWSIQSSGLPAGSGDLRF